MKNFIASLIITMSTFLSCQNIQEKSDLSKTPETPLQVQGHRGDRGNYPENSIPAFISAAEKGVDVIELDVVISKDHKVVVSHEPFMSSLYTSTPSGVPITKAEERLFNFYEMTYDSIKAFDAGSRGNPLFPDQTKIRTYKPLLSEVLDSLENYSNEKNKQPIKYNIELKSVEFQYDTYQPKPEIFVDLVMQVVLEKEAGKKTIIQSFDPNILNVMHEKFPNITLAYLTSKTGIEENLANLKVKPEIYSPHYKLVKDRYFVDSIKSLDMNLIPWTINKESDIQRMIDLKVDGIITDYPEKVLKHI